MKLSKLREILAETKCDEREGCRTGHQHLKDLSDEDFLKATTAAGSQRGKERVPVSGRLWGNCPYCDSTVAKLVAALQAK